MDIFLSSICKFAYNYFHSINFLKGSPFFSNCDVAYILERYALHYEKGKKIFEISFQTRSNGEIIQPPFPCINVGKTFIFETAIYAEFNFVMYPLVSDEKKVS